MITTQELPDVLRRLGATDVEHRQDRKRSISSTTIRFVKDGRRGVAVGAEMAHQIDVFTDLVSLHLDDAGRGFHPTDLWVWFAERPGDGETSVALQTLASSTRTLKVHLRAITPDGGLAEPADERVPWSDADHYRYRQWADLLRAVPEEPPGLVTALVMGTERPEYRAYPMLSSRGRRWSIRFEGLQVAVCSATSGCSTSARTAPTGASATTGAGGSRSPVRRRSRSTSPRRASTGPSTCCGSSRTRPGRSPGCRTSTPSSRGSCAEPCRSVRRPASLSSSSGSTTSSTGAASSPPVGV